MLSRTPGWSLTISRKEPKETDLKMMMKKHGAATTMRRLAPLTHGIQIMTTPHTTMKTMGNLVGKMAHLAHTDGTMVNPTAGATTTGTLVNIPAVTNRTLAGHMTQRVAPHTTGTITMHTTPPMMTKLEITPGMMVQTKISVSSHGATPMVRLATTISTPLLEITLHITMALLARQAGTRVKLVSQVTITCDDEYTFNCSISVELTFIKSSVYTHKCISII